MCVLASLPHTHTHTHTHWLRTCEGSPGHGALAHNLTIALMLLGGHFPFHLTYNVTNPLELYFRVPATSTWPSLCFPGSLLAL